MLAYHNDKLCLHWEIHFDRVKPDRGSDLYLEHICAGSAYEGDDQEVERWLAVWATFGLYWGNDHVAALRRSCSDRDVPAEHFWQQHYAE